MAANLAAIRNALERMGFEQPARVYIVDVQGFDDLEEFAFLEDKEVENLCKGTRRPGGTIPNPNAAVAGQPANIPNPGIPVSLMAENNLKLMCYYLRYLQRTSYQLEADNITLDNVRALRGLRREEATHTDVMPPEINTQDWPKTIDAIIEWLKGCKGATKIPLARVIRDEIEITEEPEGGFATRQEELILRSPIMEGEVFTEDYLTDRTEVWEKLHKLTEGEDCFSFAKPGQKTRDGRMAFMGLKNWYLGPNNVDTMSTQAENTLKTTTYRGEVRRWNFEKYVKVHVDQHAILEGLMEYGYAGIDPRSKVRWFMDGIKTDKLDPVNLMIMANTDLRNDFDACVQLYKEFIKTRQSTAMTREVTIAAVQSQQHESSDHVEPDMTVQDRYYTVPEYRQMSQAQKLGLKLIRSGRKTEGKPGKKKGKATVNLSKRSIKAILSASKGNSAGLAERIEDSDDSDDAASKPSASKKQKKSANRDNKALSRRK